ncbi:tetratricopeptide repeat protein [Luteibacter sp. dw_328]|uniref:glycosyltransferase n=1 Tax=Luteibacter sp. dw_328 TaxID=2719796 RepID=UPI001BD262B8|nr:tetratricopeptide repeat protein [Luteibacter sp. dw_328]
MSEVRPLISACIIVRDEAALLPRCIASLGDLCDEIRVLDTGSRDATVMVARALGAHVDIDSSCNDADGLIADFSRARNICLGLARGRWILQIDADEILQAGHAALRDVVQTDATDVLGITLRSGGRAWVGTRFFRADAARGYEGRIHERLDYQGRYQAMPEVAIENHPDKAGKEPSSTRNLRLSRLAVRESPDDSRAWYYLGQEERRIGAFDAATEAYRRCIDGGRHPISAFHSRYYLAVCQFLSERYTDALIALDDAIATDRRYAEGHCLRGDINVLLGDTGSAVADFERALACGAPPADAVFAVDAACYDTYPTSCLERLATERSMTGNATS